MTRRSNLTEQTRRMTRSARRLSRRIGFLLAPMLVVGVASALPPQYTAKLISTDIVAVAMNESGDVVGNKQSPMRAWVSRGGAMSTLLPLPTGYASSWATDINDLGVIVGAVSTTSSPEFNGKAAAWFPNGSGGYTVQVLGTLPGHVRSNATAINNLGDIIGFSANSMFRYAVLFTAPGGIQDLSPTGVFDPWDINEERVLVDHSFTSKKLDLDTMQVEDLGVPGPGYLASTASAINESGQVAGLVILTTSTSCDRQAARFTEEIGWEIDSTCGPSNGAVDINDHGDTVMQIQLAAYVRFEGEGTYLIEDLIVADAGAWYTLTFSSLAINNARQLVVSATNPTINQSGVLLLTPIGVTGDLDLDGDVDAADLGALLGAWGSCSGCPADLDEDGSVGASDLAILLGAWS